ncbi:MAG: hypothetical protein QOE65_2997 [Solirubrobacteraceae bacterium]|jgi:hypothetical protein|nr:hypothetical protein [Solirubrobacteraceae bacterium]
MPPFDDLRAYIDPNAIEAYLLAHGWQSHRRTEAFSTWSMDGEGGRHVQLFVPLSREPADYEDRLREVVTKLARTEGRDDDVMLTNLRYATADLVRIRLVSPRVGPGELPIDDGKHLFDGARDMMLAAACAAIAPRANYGPRKPAQATDYLDGVRLGQTERGSYVVTVISNVAPPEQQALMPEEAAHIDMPFERRVTTQLVESLAAAQSAADRVLTETRDVADVFEPAVDSGVSANLCDAIATMGAEQLSAKVNVSVDWSVSRPATTTAPPAVTFEPSSLPVLGEAVKVLRRLGPFDNELIEGFVARLIRGKQDEIGTIVVEGQAQGEPRNVHVELPDEQYHLAIQAHDERRPVQIRGTLLKRGRTWVLSDPGQLRLEA